LVYLDSSVVLAYLGAEVVVPPASLWDEELISSRLLAYETMSRLHAWGRGESHGQLAKELFRRIAFLELIGPVVGRAGEPFPVALRTLDALHLATITFLVEQGVPVRLASYDRRLSDAAKSLRIEPYPL